MRQSGNKHKRALSRLKVVLANTGDPNTFRREEMGTIIDIMFISDTLTIQGYVSEHYMHRNHQVIIFQMRTTIRSKQRKTPDMDVQKAATSYKFVLSENAMDMATQILEWMPIACDVFMVSGGILKSMNIVKFAEMREGDVNASI